MGTPAETDRVTVETGLCSGPVQVRHLDWPADCGAECLFVGRTRTQRHAVYGPLVGLDFQVYVPMAEKLLARLADTAVARFGCRAVRILHSYGLIQTGEASVVIQVATPHRGEAFEACQYLIEKLKHRLPIWKREVWAGGETFVEGCCVPQETDCGN